jgi:hypothetical protein
MEIAGGSGQGTVQYLSQESQQSTPTKTFVLMLQQRTCQGVLSMDPTLSAHVPCRRHPCRIYALTDRPTPYRLAGCDAVAVVQSLTVMPCTEACGGPRADWVVVRRPMELAGSGVQACMNGELNGRVGVQCSCNIYYAVLCAVLWWEDVGHHRSARAVVLGLTDWWTSRATLDSGLAFDLEHNTAVLQYHHPRRPAPSPSLPALQSS